MTGGGWDRKGQLGNLFGNNCNFCSLFVDHKNKTKITLCYSFKKKNSLPPERRHS